MVDKLQSATIGFQGGLIENEDTIRLNNDSPGAAIFLQNYETGIFGGYRRVKGFVKYDSTEVPGTGKVLGAFIFNGGVVACRDTVIHFGVGSGWGAAIVTGQTSAKKYNIVKYNWTGTDNIILCDGTNNANRYDGSSVTTINASGAPADPHYVEQFSNHMFYAGYAANKAAITFSAPDNEISFLASAGAGEIVIGDEVVQLKAYRDALYIFCQDSIWKLTGSSAIDFSIEAVTRVLGCVATWSVQEIAGDLVFLSPTGYRTIAATDRLGGITLNSISLNIQDLISGVVDAATSTENVSSLVIRGKNQLRLFYTASGTDVSDAMGIIGGLRNNAEGNVFWEWGELKGIKVSCADSDFVTDDETIIHGAFDGFVYQQEQGNSFNGANIISQFRTPHLFFGEFGNRKIFHKLTLFYRVEGVNTITVQPVFDFDRSAVTMQPDSISVVEGQAAGIYGTSVYGTATYGGTEFPQSTNNLIGSGQTMQIWFTTNDISSQFSLQGMEVQFLTEGRR